MEISAQLVKDLREKTGAGMMDCKKALSEAKGDLDSAIEYLRKQGLKAASNKAARTATEGIIADFISADKNTVVLLEVNSETDFVAKNPELVAFASEVASLIAEKNPDTIDSLSALNLKGGKTVNDILNELIAKIGEKISLRRFIRQQATEGEKFGSYIHLGSKIGVIVALKGPKADEALARDIAMHVAASHPMHLNRTEIPQTALDKEKGIFLEQMKDSGKPANVLEKIVEGKLAKYASEICLNDQVYIKDPTGKKSVSAVLKETNPDLRIVSFTRYQVGEGMEKKKDDFAAEVAKMVQ